jgi:hypothetical protein
MAGEYNLGMVSADGKSALPEGIFDMSDPALIAELGEEAEKKIREIVSEFEGGIVARYKLEVFFNTRYRDKPYHGLVMAFTNGGFDHGGGDAAIYFCAKPDPNDPTKYCHGIVPLEFINKKMALCPKCQRPSRPTELAGQVGYYQTTQFWAATLLRAYRAVECNADIMLHHYEGDLRGVTELEQKKQMHGEKLNALRAQRRAVVYTQARIVEDVTAGASLEARFRAFLMA